MRLWLQKFLPIAILAVTIQALTPLFAFGGFVAAADPLGAMVLCSQVSSAVDDGRAPLTGHDQLDACCALCAPLADNVALITPFFDAADHPSQPKASYVGWFVVSYDAANGWSSPNAWARAPPIWL